MLQERNLQMRELPHALVLENSGSFSDFKSDGADSSTVPTYDSIGFPNHNFTSQDGATSVQQDEIDTTSKQQDKVDTTSKEQDEIDTSAKKQNNELLELKVDLENL